MFFSCAWQISVLRTAQLTTSHLYSDIFDSLESSARACQSLPSGRLPLDASHQGCVHALPGAWTHLGSFEKMRRTGQFNQIPYPRCKRFRCWSGVTPQDQGLPPVLKNQEVLLTTYWFKQGQVNSKVRSAKPCFMI